MKWLVLQKNFPSIDDEETIAIANQAGRIIVTFDSDFGELIYKHGVKCSTGVIYFRIHKFLPDEPANLILYRHEKMKTVFEKSFIVLTRKTIRQRLL